MVLGVPAGSIRVRAGVVLLENDSILLVQHVKGDKKYWLFPGGGLNFRETAENAAKREVKEECSLDISIVKLLFISEAISPDGELHILNLIFLGKVISGELKVNQDDRLKDAKFIPLDQLDSVKIYPSLMDELKNAIKNGFNDKNIYLGQIWH